MLQNSHVWTENNHAEAVEMWAEGRSMSEIANHFCISRGAVSGYVSRNRDVFAVRRQGQATKPRVRASGRVHAVWTPDKVKQAAVMWKRGTTAAEIAGQFSVTPRAFMALVHRYRETFPIRSSVNRREREPKERRPKREVPVNLDTLFEAAGSSTMYDGSQYQLTGQQPIAFASLKAKECVFPVSAPDDPPGPEMPCCGAPVAYGPYCSAHAAICWRGRA